MTKNNTKSPQLVFDMKNRCIRIHKRTLHMLNDPDYIQFLVNPAKKIMALRVNETKGELSEKIDWEKLENRSVEVYSTTLIYKLKVLLPKGSSDCSYIVNGTYVEDENLIAFDMSKAKIREKV